MLILVLAIAITARASVGLGPFSGQANTPELAKAKEMPVPWGDFECHRLWIEITNNLETRDWYEDTKYNNKTYWPMDYPPLCAHFHYFTGRLVKWAIPEAFVLG